ncbi:MAG: hypothetical protein HY331_08555 [Chloroflexi bacterium]|nr:hypothetical protein [Chloroflexota bacterium]
MARPTIAAFVFDDVNEEKFARHGLTAVQVSQVLENEHVVVRNRRGRRALLLLIGFDHGGTCIAMPIEATHDPVVWRPVTAWRCKAYERGKLD